MEKLTSDTSQKLNITNTDLYLTYHEEKANYYICTNNDITVQPTSFVIFEGIAMNWQVKEEFHQKYFNPLQIDNEKIQVFVDYNFIRSTKPQDSIRIILINISDEEQIVSKDTKICEYLKTYLYENEPHSEQILKTNDLTILSTKTFSEINTKTQVDSMLNGSIIINLNI